VAHLLLVLIFNPTMDESDDADRTSIHTSYTFAEASTMMQRPLPTASAHHSPVIAILRVLALAVAASALNITYYHGNTASSIQPYASFPASHVRRNAVEVVRVLADTWCSTVWKLVEAVALECDTFEPEGMAWLGPDRIVVSAGEYTALKVSYGKGANGFAIIMNGTDRANGAGFAHLLVWQHTSPWLRTLLVLFACA
jgi:hypothetical protein